MKLVCAMSTKVRALQNYIEPVERENVNWVKIDRWRGNVNAAYRSDRNRIWNQMVSHLDDPSSRRVLIWFVKLIKRGRERERESQVPHAQQVKKLYWCPLIFSSNLFNLAHINNNHLIWSSNLFVLIQYLPGETLHKFHTEQKTKFTNTMNIVVCLLLF